MNCAKCGYKMTQLFVSWVCDNCNPPGGVAVTSPHVSTLVIDLRIGVDNSGVFATYNGLPNHVDDLWASEPLYMRSRLPRAEELFKHRQCIRAATLIPVHLHSHYLEAEFLVDRPGENVRTVVGSIYMKDGERCTLAPTFSKNRQYYGWRVTFK